MWAFYPVASPCRAHPLARFTIARSRAHSRVRLAVRPELVEGSFLSCSIEEGQPFDKLRANGVYVMLIQSRACFSYSWA